MCELLVGLPDVLVVGIDDLSDGPLIVTVEQAGARPGCIGCGAVPVVKDREVVELVDLPYAGRQSRLAWRKIRWSCPDPDCEVTSWTWSDPRIGAPRQALTDRAARWVTLQVGRHGRSVAEVAGELGCAWHTVNTAVIAYGEALVDDDPERIGTVTALGLDETMFCRTGPYRTQHWSTSIVDVSGAGCSMWSKAVPVLARVPGWLDSHHRGERTSPGPRWTSPAPIGRCLTPCCPTPSRSPTRYAEFRVTGHMESRELCGGERGWGRPGLVGSEVTGPSGRT